MEKIDTLERVDDNHESVWVLFKLRMPSLIMWLALGIGISLITASFEEVLSKNIQIAFFLPFVVYIADAVGTQTESIYASNLKTNKTNKVNIKKYFLKEWILWLMFGIGFGILSWIITLLWLGDKLLSLSVSIASALAIITAPIVALIISYILQLLGKDPAAGTWPIATVIQDMISVIIYWLVASIIML